MCPDEDDVLEKTAAKSNPGNSRGVASMNSFVARAPTNQSPPEHLWERPASETQVTQGVPTRRTTSHHQNCKFSPNPNTWDVSNLIV